MSEQPQRPPTDDAARLLVRAAAFSQNTHSYCKQVHQQPRSPSSSTGNPGGGGGGGRIWMEIDGDFNDYTDEQTLELLPALGLNHRRGAAIVATADDSAFSESALVRGAAAHNLLARTGHRGVGVLSNYAVFALMVSPSTPAHECTCRASVC